MKKLNLTPSTFQKGDVLTRSQLKKVLGGDYGSGSYGGSGGGGGGGGGGWPPTCLITVTHAPTGGADYTNMPSERGHPIPTNSQQASEWCADYMGYHPGTSCSYSC